MIWSNHIDIEFSKKESISQTSINYYRSISMGDFAEYLMEEDYYNKEYLLPLGYWWEQWGYLSQILYVVYRYEDKVFSKKVKKKLTRLMGEMASRRYDVIVGSTNHYDADHDKVILFEKAFFVKYDCYLVLLDKELRENEYKDINIDIKPIMDKVKSMTIKETKELIKNHEEEIRYKGPFEEKPIISTTLGIKIR